MNYEIKLMAENILSRTGFKGKIAIVLGSGLGDFSKNFTDPTVIAYDSIPEYPQPTVEGHAGEFVFGKLEGIPILAARGRFHFYEGHPVSTVTLPIKLFNALGIQYVIITNAAGSMEKEFPPGKLMLITRHLDCTFRESHETPEWVENPPYYDPNILQIVRHAAVKTGVDIAEGGYCWTQGPVYETPAEIDFYSSLNGTAVGMSTVPEIETAGELGMTPIGISCLTNYAAGITDQPLTHQEVMDTAEFAKNDFAALIKETIVQLGSRK